MPAITVANGTTLTYDTMGPATGRPLLLIEGLTAQMIKWRAEYCALLVDAGFYVIRFDNRDVGLSQKFPGQLYSLTDMAEDTIGLIEALDIAPCHVMGQSMGGMIAQVVAATRPDLVASLDLIYTTASRRDLLSPAGDRDVLTGHAASDRDAAIEEYVAGELVCRSAVYPQDISFLREVAGQAFDRDPLKEGNPRQTHAVFTSEDRTELVTQITAPTLVLAGDADLLIDPRGSTELHHLIEGSTLRILPGMGHEVPEPLWTTVVAHVKANADRFHGREHTTRKAAVNTERATLELRGIKKTFGHVAALKGVDLSAYAGEILAVVGDNGAGKSSLIRTISGVYRPDEGVIVVDGEPHTFANPAAARSAGVATVFQDLALIEVLDVATNMFIGQFPRRGPFVRRRAMEREARAFLTELGVSVASVRTEIGMLSGGQRQIVAIARAMRSGGHVVLLDEPTAALGVRETAQAADMIRALRDRGNAVIIVSHDMSLVFELADRIQVMRLGEVAGVRRREATTRDEIIGLITGAIVGETARAT